VQTVGGKTLYQRKNFSPARVIDPQYVSMMNTMMQETLSTGTARKAELPGWQAAGKTGTSQDFRDAWFIGYTSRLVTGVWLGNDDSSPTKKASGGNLPVEIWSRYMGIALKGVAVAGLPSSDWRDSAGVAIDEVVAKPLDDLIGLFTGGSRREAAPPPRQRQTAAPAPRPQPRDEAPDPAPEADETATIAVPAPPPRPRPAQPKPQRAADDFLPPGDIPGADDPAPPPPRPRRAERAPDPEKSIIDDLFRN
jgi:penicillin-binding protein 1A